MAFDDVRLPDDIERGSEGGPRFKTTILTLSSGHEQRNRDFEQTRGAWDIGYGIMRKNETTGITDFSDIIAFFMARNGRFRSFRFKDWADFEIGKNATNTPQTIGTGDGILTVFQISRLYEDLGSFTFSRTITKIVATPTPRIFLDAVEQGSGFTINLLTGKVTFTSAPGASVLVRIICEFDNPVRFDTDGLDTNLLHFNAGSIPNLPVIEVRGE